MDDYQETPNNKIKANIRKLWLRSVERSQALKRDAYTCQKCLKKQCKAQGREFSVQVHHKEGILNWDAIIASIREQLLVSPDKLVTLCKECHLKETYSDSSGSG
jgi:5-methylcytosine-specific restriction endonuclease McrA